MTPSNKAQFTQREKESDNQKASGMLARDLTGITGGNMVLLICQTQVSPKHLQQETVALSQARKMMPLREVGWLLDQFLVSNLTEATHVKQGF